MSRLDYCLTVSLELSTGLFLKKWLQNYVGSCPGQSIGLNVKLCSFSRLPNVRPIGA